MRNKRREAWRRALALGLALICAAFLMQAAGAEEDPSAMPELEVHFLNVDRNDAILIRCGGEAALIDGGARMCGETILQYLEALGVTELKYYVATHAHSDHVGCAPLILCSTSVKSVMVGSELTKRCMWELARSDEEREALEKARYRTIRRSSRMRIGGALLTCIAPGRMVEVESWLDGMENHNSLVLRLSYGEKSFLLTADAMTPTFYELLKKDPEALKCTVYKNAHHNGTFNRFVEENLQAEYVVFQTSSDYLPSQDCIDLLRTRGMTPLITCKTQAGTTVFRTDGQSLSYTTQYEMGYWTLNYQQLNLKAGMSEIVSAKTGRMNVNTLMWRTSDPEVAVIDPVTSRVTAIAPGKCVITARAYDGSERSVKVKVS